MAYGGACLSCPDVRCYVSLPNFPNRKYTGPLFANSLDPEGNKNTTRASTECTTVNHRLSAVQKPTAGVSVILVYCVWGLIEIAQPMLVMPLINWSKGEVRCIVGWLSLVSITSMLYGSSMCLDFELLHQCVCVLADSVFTEYVNPGCRTGTVHSVSYR